MTNKKGDEVKSNILIENIEALKKKVEAIQEGVCELRASGLNEDMIYYAVQRAAQKHNRSYSPIKITDIRAVMLGLEELNGFMFPEKKETF